MKRLIYLLGICLFGASAWAAAGNPITLMSLTDQTVTVTSSPFEINNPRNYGNKVKGIIRATANVVGTLDVDVEESPVCDGSEPASMWTPFFSFAQITSGTDVVEKVTPNNAASLMDKCLRVTATIAGGGADYDVEVIMYAE